MAEIVRTNDPALISAVEGLLQAEEIPHHVADRTTSALDGLIGVIEQRVLVPDERADDARALLVDAELGEYLHR